MDEYAYLVGLIMTYTSKDVRTYFDLVHSTKDFVDD
jgi:hypothetical protein